MKKLISLLILLMLVIPFYAYGIEPGLVQVKDGTADAWVYQLNFPAGSLSILGATATYTDVGGAPTTAHYLTSQAEAGLSAEVNLGALSTGLLYVTVAGGVATPYSLSGDLGKIVKQDETGPVYTNSVPYLEITTSIDIGADGVNLVGSNGTLKIKGIGDGQDEDLVWDFNTTAQTVLVQSSSGVTKVDFADTIGLEAKSFASTVATGTAPLTVASTTVVPNLNPGMYHLCRTITNPSDSDLFLFDIPKNAFTVSQIHGICVAGTSVVIDIKECDAAGANCVDTQTAALTIDTDGATTGTFDDAAVAGGNVLKLDIGTVTGAVTQVMVCVEGN